MDEAQRVTRDIIGDRLVIASVSGGKDSAAMCLWLQEQEIEHVRVFADTGWEAAATYEYLRGPLTEKLGQIHEVGYPGGMPALVTKKRMFPSRVRRFCTENLKVKPILAFIESLRERDEVEVINAIGIRSGESLARSRLTEWEWSDSFDCDVWRPLIAWTEQDVIDIHARHGLAPNPLYLRGASRVGCWPCIFSRKKEIAHIADVDPARIDTIRELEHEAERSAAARYAAKGETFDSLGYGLPTFFQAPGALRKEGKDGRMVGIDEVVRWSRTARGGRQFELFAPETEPGCVRWGMCEGTGDAEADDHDDTDRQR